MDEMKLAETLVQLDLDKKCPFCSKSEWGEWERETGEGDHRHYKNCPFAIAYDMLSQSAKNKRFE